MRLSSSTYYGKGQFPGAKIKIPKAQDKGQKFTIKFSVDEPLFAKLKQFHIWPSEVCVAALRREATRRQKAAGDRKRRRMKGQIVNRYIGEVLTT